MSIPGFQDLMLPLARLASDGADHSIRDSINQLAEELQLTEDDLAEMLPSGRQRTFHNRVHWAKTFLTKTLPLVLEARETRFEVFAVQQGCRALQRVTR